MHSSTRYPFRYWTHVSFLFVACRELETKVSSAHQRYAKWKSIFDAKESPAAKELPALTARASFLYQCAACLGRGRVC